VTFPTGTVTFLFTDIEGSTRLWDLDRVKMQSALARHDCIVREAVIQHGGVVFKTVGDAFCAAFLSPPDAVSAAIAAQRGLSDEPWPASCVIKVRMAIHSGVAEFRDQDYFGPPLNRLARLLSIGHGGQVLLSEVVKNLCGDFPPDDIAFQPLGEYGLKDLKRSESVFQLVHPDLAFEFPPLRSSRTFPTNLPAQLTSFVGRVQEIEQIKEGLRKARLLTLSGPGGCGKTRLSLQVGGDLNAQFEDGVWFVELAPVSDPQLILQIVISALGMREHGEKPALQVLCDYLRAKKALLILDNCEHLVTACASMVDAILRFCPHVKVLISSREALGVPGELTFPVPCLSLPSASQKLPLAELASCEAVRLFAERACSFLPSFEITLENAAALVSICRRLDGIPLAIELAAARIRTLSVGEIDLRLADRFRLLTGGSKTLAPRQQTLSALIDWSYTLLTALEQSVLKRLTVFDSSWSLDAAESVCAGDEIEKWDVLDLVTSLTDKSLVVAERCGNSTRYRLLESIREYGKRQSIESGRVDAVRDRHLEFFLSLALQAQPNLKGPDQKSWFSRLEFEHENFRTALDWCFSEGRAPQRGAELATALGWFWFVRGHWSEGTSWLNRSLEALPLSEPAMRAKALILTAWIEIGRDRNRARSLAEESLALGKDDGDSLICADALNFQSILTREQGDYPGARREATEALRLYEAAAVQVGVAHALNNLGRIANYQGFLDEAESFYLRALDLLREVGGERELTLTVSNMGYLYHSRLDYASAITYFSESLQLAEQLGDQWLLCSAYADLGVALVAISRFESAMTILAKGLRMGLELGESQSISVCLDGFAAIHSAQGNPHLAAQLSGVADAVRDHGRVGLPESDRPRYEAYVQRLRDGLGDATFALAWNHWNLEGLEVTLHSVLEKATSSTPAPSSS
jgi:predicted ATPase/class 3 adenylate cyclase